MRPLGPSSCVSSESQKAAHGPKASSVQIPLSPSERWLLCHLSWLGFCPHTFLSAQRHVRSSCSVQRVIMLSHWSVLWPDAWLGAKALVSSKLGSRAHACYQGGWKSKIYMNCRVQMFVFRHSDHVTRQSIEKYIAFYVCTWIYTCLCSNSSFILSSWRSN